MAIKTFTAAEVRDLNIPQSYNGGTSKYPWNQIEKGGAFFVPRTNTTREDYRPAVPPNLKKTGYKVSVRKYVYNGVVGMFVKRIA
jgi:hypothetical protein